MLTCLSKLVFTDTEVSGTPGMLSTLTAISSLQKLALDIRMKTAAYGDRFFAPFTLLHVATLFRLPNLTHLHLPTVVYEFRGVAAAGPSVAALASLCRMTQLQSLKISGHKFHVDDAVFAGLRQLTGLTELMVGSIAVTSPSPGHLPALRHLQLGAGRPSQVLASLQPLLPLLSLECLGCEISDTLLSLDLDGCSLDSTAAVLANNDSTATVFANNDLMRQLSSILAAAPQLAQRGLRIVCNDTDSRQPPPAGQALQVERFQPIRHLLDLLPQQILRLLTALYLVGCALTVPMLVSLAEHLPALQDLRWDKSVVDDPCVSAISLLSKGMTRLIIWDGHGASMSRNGWLALAALPRDTPLTGGGVQRL